MLPALSTARCRYFHSPLTWIQVSSIRQLLPTGRSRLCRSSKEAVVQLPPLVVCDARAVVTHAKLDPVRVIPNSDSDSTAHVTVLERIEHDRGAATLSRVDYANT